MLSVNSVNVLSQQPAFRGEGVANPYQDDGYKYYTKDAYESDKIKLEQQLDDMNELIENTGVPKPVRAFGKVVSVGIGAVLGFVSMKYGAQGVTKLLSTVGSSVKKFAEKPACKKIREGFKDLFTGAKNKITKKGTQFIEYLEKTDLGVKIKLAKKVEKVKNVARQAKTKLNEITKERVEKGVINVFAVSGGVTGGITALQEVTKDAE